MQERTTKTHQYIGDLKAEFTTVWYGNEGLDTRVDINGQYFVTITHADIYKFSEELNQVVNKYRI